MTSTKLRLGLLSTGNIARQFAAGVRASDRCVLQAVGSRTLASAQAFAQVQQVGNAYGSYDKVIADPDVDAIYIGLPNSMHHPWAIKALRAGKHVLCEKPIAVSVGEAQQMYQAATDAKRVLVEAFMYRCHPQTLKVMDTVRSGAIGVVRLIRTSFNYKTGRIADNIRFNADLAGGALMDIGCYCLSGCRTLAGTEPVRVHGESVTTPDGVDVSFSGLIRFAHDVRATFDCSFAAVPHHSLEAIGTDGRLRLDDPWHGRRPVISLTGADGATSDVDCSSALGSYALELEDFEAAVAGERAPLLGREDAMRQARTIAALYASAATNEGVTP